MPSLTTAAAAEIFRAEPDEMIDVGDGEVAYRRVGDGPDVLFVHGWPVSGATFRGLLPHLADHVTCHVVDLLSAGSSRFAPGATPTVEGHVRSVRAVVDHLDVDLAVVGHDSGGLIARHALVGHPRLRAMGLIDTEPLRPGWRFRSFIAARHLPGFGAGFGWVAGRPKLRRNRFVLGGAFVDRSLLDGEFDEFFLRPLHESRVQREAATAVLRSFAMQLVRDLEHIHPRLDVPVQLVWGDRDPFFPVAQAEAMVESFPDARLAVIEGAALFSHEERPEAVARALLDTLTGDR